MTARRGGTGEAPSLTAAPPTSPNGSEANRSRSGSALKRLARIAGPVLIGLAGAWIGLTAWGNQTVTMGPFVVRVDANFGRGLTDIALPPLGHLEADSHLAPLRLQATLEDVGLPRLAKEFGHRPVSDIVGEVETDAARAIRSFAFRLAIVSVAATLALGVLVFRARWRAILAAVLTAAVAVGGSEALAWQTFRPSAFLSPTFHGSLSAAPGLLGPVRTATQRIEDFRAQLEQIVDGAMRVYRRIPAEGLSGDDVTVLHISDIHLSPLGMEFALHLARSFHADFVIDTGDLTSFGTPADSLITTLVPKFHRPYVFVRGNHDSMQVQQEMELIPNVVVLDGGTTTVDGLTIYGLGDPAFTPNKQSPVGDKQVEELVRSVDGKIRSDLEALPRPPDLVAVHDDRMAAAVAGMVPLVVSGHFHSEASRTVDGTLFLRVGTTGGTGATVLTEGGKPLSAEVLHFRTGSPLHLVAYDVIDQSLGGSLKVVRHLVPDTSTPEATSSPTSAATEAMGAAPTTNVALQRST
jgi:predicted phosphodiesterase